MTAAVATQSVLVLAHRGTRATERCPRALSTQGASGVAVLDRETAALAPRAGESPGLRVPVTADLPLPERRRIGFERTRSPRAHYTRRVHVDRYLDLVARIASARRA